MGNWGIAETASEKENDDFRELGELLARLAGGELTPEECAAAQVVSEELENV